VTGSWNTGSIGGGLLPLRGPSGAPRVMGEPPLSPPTSAAVPPLEGAQLHSVHFDQPAPAPVPAAADPTPANGAGSLESLLLRFRLITPDQLDEADRLKLETGRDIGAIVVERGWATEDQLSRLLSYAPTLAPEEPAPGAEQPAFEPAPQPAVQPAAEPQHWAEAATHSTLQAVPEPAFEPAPAPVVEPQPVAIVEPALEPVGLVEPASAPVPEPFVEQAQLEVAARVFVRLTTGERLEVGAFGNLDSARTGGAEVVRQLMAAGTEWPVFGGRFVRPDAVVSVDVEPTLN
jgi:hypothetical protein